MSFGNRFDQFTTQLHGVGPALLWVLGVSMVLLKVVDSAMRAFAGRGMRAAASELEGLNSSEHGLRQGMALLERNMLSLINDESGDKKRVRVAPNKAVAELGHLINQLLDKIDEDHHARDQASKIYTGEIERALAREKALNVSQQQFISMASHEFRTPLSIIDGAAQRLLRRKELGPEDLSRGVDKIRRAVKRLTQLIDRTLSASRLEEGRVSFAPQFVSIIEIIETVCRRQGDISRNHNIVLDIAGLPEEVYADPQLIEQVFTNLISNAIKYSPNSHLIDIHGWQTEKHLYVSVTDHGLGVPEDELPRLFERFFRARTATGIAGTGIGLNVVREFVDLHDGSIKVTSKEGAGSTFTVQLPLQINTSAADQEADLDWGEWA